MILATVSSQSCLCWLYRSSPSFSANNIINLISMSTVWWCPRIESSLVLLEEGVCYDPLVFSWQNSLSLFPASLCTPRPNLPVTPGISWLPTFAFQSPMMKRTCFLAVLEGLVGLHRTIELQLLQRDYCHTKLFALVTNRHHSVVFVIAPKYCISVSFFWLWGPLRSF